MIYYQKLTFSKLLQTSFEIIDIIKSTIRTGITSIFTIITISNFIKISLTLKKNPTKLNKIIHKY